MAEHSAPLRIGVDGYNLAMARGTGIATYARTLCAAIMALGHRLDLVYGLGVSAAAPSGLRESLFYARLGEDVADEAAARAPGLRQRFNRAALLPIVRDMVEVPVASRVIAPELVDRLPPRDRLFTRNGIFNISALYFRRYGRFMTLRVPDPPDVMHWTYPLPLRIAGAANIYTVHDLVPLRLPHTSLEDRLYYDRLIRACIAEAPRIVTVSETSRADILNLFGADPARVVNTYQPIALAPSTADPAGLAQRLGRIFGLSPGQYFLFFGAIEPKKNVGRLLEAYLGANVDTPLVIAGARGWRAEQELRLLRHSEGAGGAGGSIRMLDYLPRTLLADLVRGARALLFPSLYEGFGLPAVEAMSLGIPTLVGGGSLPEVVGDAGLAVDPYDVPAITAAIERLDRDAGLRERLSAAGIIRAQRYDAEHYRASIDRLYREVMGAASSS